MRVFDKAETLIDYTITMTDNIKRYPKKRKFSFVNRMQSIALDTYEYLSNANEVPLSERRDLQVKALGKINLLLFFIKYSLKKGFISKRQCELWTKKALDVKYLTAAWMKKSK